MADTMKFDLVSPERSLSSVEAREIRLPGMAGDLTVMPGHAPVITTLRPGVVRVITTEGQTEFALTGGFAEITGSACTVLAERSLAAADLTQAIYDEMVEELRQRHATAREGNLPGPADELVKLMGDMVAMGTHVGLDPRQPNL
jgi:F-type H+-transporting ATPase subunit epsilon